MENPWKTFGEKWPAIPQEDKEEIQKNFRGHSFQGKNAIPSLKALVNHLLIIRWMGDEWVDQANEWLDKKESQYLQALSRDQRRRERDEGTSQEMVMHKVTAFSFSSFESEAESLLKEIVPNEVVQCTVIAKFCSKRQ